LFHFFTPPFVLVFWLGFIQKQVNFSLLLFAAFLCFCLLEASLFPLFTPLLFRFLFERPTTEKEELFVNFFSFSRERETFEPKKQKIFFVWRRREFGEKNLHSSSSLFLLRRRRYNNINSKESSSNTKW